MTVVGITRVLLALAGVAVHCPKQLSCYQYQSRLEKRMSNSVKNKVNFDWKRELGDILKRHAGIRANGKPASHRTKEQAAQVMMEVFQTLHGLGYKVMPQNLGDRHVRILMNEWYFKKKLKIRTVVNYLGTMRKFAGWIGKSNMVLPIAKYLPNVPAADLKIRSVAVKSKSWAGNGLDEQEYFKKADQLDVRFGCMLRAQKVFGLRLIEVLQMRPWHWDFDAYLFMPENVGKNGRERPIQIRVQEQREVLEFIKSKVGKDEYLGWSHAGLSKTAKLHANYQHYQYLMRKLGITKKQVGVTGHGLRAGFSEDALEGRGLVPPTRGGLPNQMSREDERIVKSKTAQDMGHNRLNFGGAYYGSFRKPKIS